MLSEEGNYPVLMMARLLQVHRSGFYEWKKRFSGDMPVRAREVRREALKLRVWKIWDDSDGTSGVRRVRAALASEGTRVSLWLVAKLMRELKISGAQTRSFVRTTIPATDVPTRRDFLGRAFTPPVPTTVLVGDITYLKTGEGWLYLATVIDLTTRMVVGWQTAAHMRASLVVDALTMAHRAGYTAGGAIFHSDSKNRSAWSSRMV